MPIEGAAGSLSDAPSGLQLASVVADVAEVLRQSGFVVDRGVTLEALADEAERVAELVGTDEARAFAELVREMVGSPPPCAGAEC